MKKLLLLTICATMTLSAQATSTNNDLVETTKTINDAVKSQEAKTVYKDVKDVTATVYNDGKSLVQQVYDDTKALAPDLKEAFKSLASSFNTTVDKLWNILVRQQYVWSSLYAILCIISIFAWYKFGKSISKFKTDLDVLGQTRLINLFYTGVLLLTAIISSVHSVENLDRMLTGFINPEFGAIRTIIEFIK